MKTPTFFKDAAKKIVSGRKAKQKLTLGIDIEQSTVRALALLSEKEKPTIISFASLAVEDTIVNTIRKVTASLSPGSYRLNIGLSGPGVIIRYINLPKMTKDELRGAMQFEAEKHIPFPVHEVTLDAYILNEHLPANQMLVLLAAVKNDLLQQRINLVRSLGLEITVVDINTIALMNAFFFSQAAGLVNQDGQGKPVGLLDIGPKFSTLNIIEGQIPQLSRDISVGSAALAAQDKDLVLANLMDEVRRSFDFYESQSNKPLASIFLSGEGAKREGLQEFLAQNIALPIKLWDPSTSCALGPNVDKELLKSQAHLLGVVLGLALR